MDGCNGDEDGWTKVVYKKSRREKPNPPRDNKSIRAVKHYWNGFNEKGEERWYLELSNGTILTPSHENYRDLVKRYFPNTHKDL